MGRQFSRTRLIRGRRLPRLRCQRAVRLRTAVAIKLPDLPYFLDHVEIQVGDQHFVFVAAGLGEDFAARIAEITLAVKLSNVPWLFPTNTIDRTYEVSVGCGVCGLLEFPQIFRESRYRGGGIENNLRAVQSEDARAFGKMAVIADVHSDARIFRLKDGITLIARGEIKFFPESGMHVGDVVLAVLAQIFAVGINDRGGIEV